MADIDQIFKEITQMQGNLSRRIAQFETWEPSSGFVDTGAHAYRTSSQSISSGAYDKVDFNAELWDTEDIHSAGTMTIVTPGKYFCKAVVATTGYSGTTYLRIYKSATEYLVGTYYGTTLYVQTSGIMLCNAGDTLIVDMYPTVNITVSGSTTYKYLTFFQIQRVG